MDKIFYAKSGIKGINGDTGPSIKEVEYTGNDGEKYTGLEFEGYASTPTLDKGGDVVLANAFDDYLEEYVSIGAPMLLQHDDNQPVGNYKELTPSDKGLFVKGLVKLDTNNLFKALKTGVICGMSIGYSIIDGAYEELEDGVVAFVIKKLRLHEISLVAIGMNQESLIKSFKDDKFKNLSDKEIKNQFKFNTNMSYSFDKSIKGAVEEFVETNNILNPSETNMDKKEIKEEVEAEETKVEAEIETEVKVEIPESVETDGNDTEQEAEINNGEVEDEVKSEEVVEVEAKKDEAKPEDDTKSAEAMEKLTKSFDDMKQNHVSEIESIKKAHSVELESYTKKFDSIDGEIKSFAEMFDTMTKALVENNLAVESIKKGLKNAEVKRNFSVDTSKDNSNATGIDRIKAIAKENTNVGRTY